jgi:HSP20 family protein
MSNYQLLDPGFSDGFENALRRMFAPLGVDAASGALKMRLDVTENDEAYQVKADIPGVKKEDIAVRVDGNIVRIDAQMKSEKETRGDGDRVVRSERQYGNISRSFSLAGDIDEARVQAKYTDGVLSLVLPKKASADVRRITIE